MNNSYTYYAATLYFICTQRKKFQRNETSTESPIVIIFYVVYIPAIWQLTGSRRPPHGKPRAKGER